MSAVETARLPQAAAAWTPSARGWAARLGVLAGLFGFVIWITQTVADFWADRIALAVIYAIIGLSLNVVMGYTGQVSLGHHAFVGLAAFTSAYYVTEKAGCNPDVGCEHASIGAFSVGVLLAILSGVISAGLLGMVALRIKGLYLALITLTYGFVALNSLFEISFLTRGGAGMPAARPKAFAGDHAFAFMCMGLLAVVLFVDWRFLRSKVGRAVLAVKESEAVAATYAVNVTAYKVMAFMMSGAFAGLAGALFAHRRGIVVAVDFTFSIALLWVLMVVVGGLGNRTGVVIGSAFFALFPFLITLVGPLDEFIRDVVKRDPEEFTLIIGPLLALVTIILYPGGIAEQISPITRWLGGRRFQMHPEGKRKVERKNLLVRLGLKRTETTVEPETATGPEASGDEDTSVMATATIVDEEPAVAESEDAHAPFKPPNEPASKSPSKPTSEPTKPSRKSPSKRVTEAPSEPTTPPTPAEVAPEEEPTVQDQPEGSGDPLEEATPSNGRAAAVGKVLRSMAARMPTSGRRADSDDPDWPDVLKPRPDKDGD